MKKLFNFNKKKVLFVLWLFLLVAVIGVPVIFATPQPVRSVEVYSEKLDYKNSESGSWKVTKSAKWISKENAEININVDTILKKSNLNSDILFVLDISESMTNEKLGILKKETSNLIENILDNNENKVALISFDSVARINQGFTNDKTVLLEKIDELVAGAGTNYYRAFLKIDEILDGYIKEENKDFTVVFLTDGNPNESTPNEVGQYNYLKAKYPFINVNVVQYEMGDKILNSLVGISDSQFVAEMDTLTDVLAKATVVPFEYSNFQVMDYIDDNYFYVESLNDIKSEFGDILFDEKNQVITWKLNNLKTGDSKRLKIKIKLKKSLEKALYPTNKNLDITSKIDESYEEVSASTNPILANNYKVIYDVNAPKECNVKSDFGVEQHDIFDVVTTSDDIPGCEGYQFKGWKISTKDVTKINDDYFIMPSSDVVIKGVWSNLNIQKTMVGKVKESLTLYKQVEEDADDEGKFVKRYTGDTTGLNGSDNIYYYYGGASNNNVVFANYCWKIVRTTGTGGVKLLYNGLPDVNGECHNTKNASQLTAKQMNRNGNTVPYNNPSDSLAYVGYMYNNSTKYISNKKNLVKKQDILNVTTMKIANDYNYYYSDNYIFDNENARYRLESAEQYAWIDNYNNLVGKYTCKSTSINGNCQTLYYVIKTDENTLYCIPLSIGSLDRGNELTITVGSDAIENLDGTYTLVDPVVINKIDWYNDYSVYKNYFTCGSNEETCADMRYLAFTTNQAFTYLERNEVFKYGKSFKYDGKNYILEDTIDVFKHNQPNILRYNHYTCFNKSGICEDGKIYYVHNAGDTWLRYIELTDGKSVEDAKAVMLLNSDVNTDDSVLKKAIDYWYSNNMVEYTKFLEDTVWCNERSIGNSSTNGWNPNGGNTYNNNLIFNANWNSNSLACKNVTDRFTVSNETGNGVLKYPVATITRNEEKLSSGSFLGSGSVYWTMTPYVYTAESAFIFIVLGNGSFSNYGAFSYAGVRPSVSLRPGIEYLSGDGSETFPYIIDIDSKL